MSTVHGARRLRRAPHALAAAARRQRHRAARRRCTVAVATAAARWRRQRRRGQRRGLCSRCSRRCCVGTDERIALVRNAKCLEFATYDGKLLRKKLQLLFLAIRDAANEPALPRRGRRGFGIVTFGAPSWPLARRGGTAWQKASRDFQAGVFKLLDHSRGDEIFETRHDAPTSLPLADLILVKLA